MEVLRSIWLFIQNEVLGMNWLNNVIGSALSAFGLDTPSRWGGFAAGKERNGSGHAERR